MLSREIILVSLFCILSSIFTAVPTQAQEAQRVFAAADSPHVISERLVVPYGEVWRVEAGTHLCFASGASFRVDGVLVAEGAADERIKFTSCDPNTNWGGLRFVDSQPIDGVQSLLAHVVIEGGRKVREEYNDRTGVDADTAGGGLFVQNSSLNVTGSVIRRNSGEIGGGVYIGAHSDVFIEKSAIYDNEAMGSRNVFSGGGGIYIEGAQRARILRSIVALNRLGGRGYGNEEGAGGIYVAHGSAELAFSLIVGNEAGKGAGMLVRPDRQADVSRRFVGNIFAYNKGSRNFEQVALQTRHTYDQLAGIGDWTNNAGQRPFVSHVNRNQFASYKYLGTKFFLNSLRPDANGDFSKELFDKVTPVVYRHVEGALATANLCGAGLDYGPIELCRREPATFQEYIDLVADEISSDGDLRQALSSIAIAPAGAELSDEDRTRLAALIDTAKPDPVPGSIPPKPLDPIIVDLVFGNDEQRSAAVGELVSIVSDAPSRGSHSPLLLTHVLGLRDEFNALLELSPPSMKPLTTAAKIRNEEAAVSLLEYYNSYYLKAENRKSLYGVLLDAVGGNLVILAERLLDDGVRPDLAYQGRLPLHLAAVQGNIDAVRLLLRRGANPNATSVYYSDGTPEPALAFATQWFHLGGGRHEIAELLIAAGAEYPVEEFITNYRERPLQMLSGIQAGVISTETAKDVVSGIGPTQGWAETARNKILGGQVAEQPVIAEIRRLRSAHTKELARIMANSEVSSTTRVAASRIISVRNFDFDEDMRTDVFASYEEPASIAGPNLSSVQDILRFRGSSRSKGGGNQSATTPITTNDDKALPKMPFGRKLAIVIGVSDYDHLPSRGSTSQRGTSYVDLSYADNDARAIERLLKSGRMGAGWEVEVYVEEQANKANIERIMKAWSLEANENDLVLFFFSGHGFPSTSDQSKSYFFLRDSNPKDLIGTALSFAETREWAIDLKAKNVILLLDACRSGLIGSSKGSLITPVDYEELKRENIALDDALASHAPGKVALTASWGAQNSYEWERQGLGFFTAGIVQILGGEIPTHATGNYVTVLNLLDGLISNVPSWSSSELETGIEQTPYYVPLEGDDLLHFPIGLNF